MGMNDDAITAKQIAARLRRSLYRYKAHARGARVFVQTSHPTWIVSDWLPPGWGARQTVNRFDHIVISWVG